MKSRNKTELGNRLDSLYLLLVKALLLFSDLEKQLRAQTQLGGGGYIGSFEERPETAVQQHFPEETVPRAKWNTPGLST